MGSSPCVSPEQIPAANDNTPAPKTRRLTELGIFDAVEEKQLMQKIPECRTFSQAASEARNGGNAVANDDERGDCQGVGGDGAVTSSCEATVVAARAAAATGAG